MPTKRSNIRYQVFAELYDYNIGEMTFQLISRKFVSSKKAHSQAYFDRFDHPTAKVVRVLSDS